MDQMKGALFGLCIGDALGVPVEFKTRDDLDHDPVEGMRGYGTHGQPPGTWSDDSSLAFCLAESLKSGYDLDDIAEKFCRWYSEGYWSARGDLFDIGGTTREAMMRLNEGVEPTQAGGSGIRDNGNGSLMRILPISFHVKNLDEVERFRKVHEVSAITHAHPRAKVGCGIYVQVVLEILDDNHLEEAVECVKEKIMDHYDHEPYAEELKEYHRIINSDISELDRKDISSSGYVVNTLEASLWCVLTTTSYKGAVLKAVNLGKDTDTVGAVTGSLAGMYYGFGSIPGEWLEEMPKKEKIMNLIEGLKKKED